MKLLRKLIPLLALSLAALPVLAQDSGGLITLDDNTPSIDVNITMPADTTGTVALDVTQTAINLVNDAGTTMLQAADARVHGLELNIAPNSGSHTLTIKRLPDVVQAAVQVRSLANLTDVGATQTLELDSVDAGSSARVGSGRSAEHDAREHPARAAERDQRQLSRRGRQSANHRCARYHPAFGVE